MRVLFTGGGTAGHINPALAAAGYLKKQQPDAEILFVGNKGGMEERLVPPAGYKIKTITISGFQRKLTPKNIAKNIKTVTRLFSSSYEAKKILKEFKPDVCVGTGGYVSGPVIREATKLKIPCVMHESNAFPGVTTKMVAKNVKAVMLAVEDAKKYFDSSVNIVITGNPVRTEILEVNREDARRKLGVDERPLILSFGGSLGAKKINEAMLPVIVKSAQSKKYQHIHGYGYGKDNAGMADMLGEINLKENPQIRVLEYINNMAECLAAADLVVSRSGAITVTEIEAMGKASILIPSPNVAENHQYHNAMALVNHGAAEIIEEKELTPERLLEKIDEIFAEKGRATEIGKKSKSMSISNVNERIYAVIMAAANKE